MARKKITRTAEIYATDNGYSINVLEDNKFQFGVFALGSEVKYTYMVRTLRAMGINYVELSPRIDYVSLVCQDLKDDGFDAVIMI